MSDALVRLPEARQRPAQLAARSDPELGEHVAQVPFDRAGGQKQLGADLGAGLHRVLADRLAGGLQFAPGARGGPGTYPGLAPGV
jgi:hypothetical protein